MPPGLGSGSLAAMAPPGMNFQAQVPLSLLILDPAIALELRLTSERFDAARKLIDRLNRDLEKSLHKMAQALGGTPDPRQIQRAAALIEQSRREADDRDHHPDRRGWHEATAANPAAARRDGDVGGPKPIRVARPGRRATV